MKTKLITALALSMILASCTVSRYAPIFTDYGKIEDGKCVLYITRASSFAGAAVPWRGIAEEYDLYNQSFYENIEAKNIVQNSYQPIVLKANTLYLFKFGDLNFVFSGTNGSESIFRIKGFTIKYSAIKGNSLIRTNFDHYFRFKPEEYYQWAESIKNADSYINLSEKKSLLDADFEILVPSKNDWLYSEMKTFRLAPSSPQARQDF